MKKKILMVVLLIALALLPLTAKSYRGATGENQLGVGLNLGTNCGVGLKYGMGKFDIVGNVGFGVLGGDLEVDAEVMYEVADIEIDRQNHLPITVGGGTQFNIGFDNEFGIGIMGLAGLEYTIPNTGWNFYLRAGLGLDLEILPEVSAGFGGEGAIGALYVFDL